MGTRTSGMQRAYRKFRFAAIPSPLKSRLFNPADNSEFSEDQPKYNALLPAELKRVLPEHSLASTDEDKLGRARQWLSEGAAREQ